MAQLRDEIRNGTNGTHRAAIGSGGRFIEHPATVQDLDDLFDRLQAQPPWPDGKIDETTQPQFCKMIGEILDELSPKHRKGGSETS
jgi:hypothetical protein